MRVDVRTDARDGLGIGEAGGGVYALLEAEQRFDEGLAQGVRREKAALLRPCIISQANTTLLLEVFRADVLSALARLRFP